MMNLSEYRNHSTCLADFLPWAGLVAPGVVLNKDGSFQRSARFRGPDLDSASESELVAVTARVNNALKRLGSGWALFVEAERRVSDHYPRSDFPEGLSWLVDEERRAAFETGGVHFESHYTLTLLFLPPDETQARAGRLLYESDEMPGIDWAECLTVFDTETDRFFALLEDVMPQMAWLSDAETLTYLHGSVSTTTQSLRVLEVPMHLDVLLADAPLTGGFKPMLGENHLRIITIRGFPTSTWPGLLDEINRLGFAYRWVTRFLFLDKNAAERELVKVRRQWFAKRKGIVTLLRETVFQQESPLVDLDATNKSADADAALQELGSDSVGFGYVTSTLAVTDPDISAVEEKRKAIERTIQGRGFVAISETLNAVESWLSSIPGQVYANVRQSLISTGNLAHLLPLSAVWAGPERNDHLDAPPLIVTRTDGSTPFRLVTHIGDVGHTLIIGPTGAGKSVLLALIMLQFRRYANSRIFAFDQGGSARATILGLCGEHYNLGSAGAIAFQPLADIDQEPARAWAADWVAGLLSHENVTITPEVKDLVWSALQSLSTAPTLERTLTGLSVLLQSNALRQALQPYTLAGPHGGLLDADCDGLGNADIQCFEMQALMHSRSAALPVLTYLFHRLDQRFDGSPTLLVLDEAWVFLDDPHFAGRIREWLKVLRKKNVSVIFATQSLSDIQASSIAPALVESCPSRIFLPATQALEPQLRGVYESFGLNDRQLRTIAHATPKREYYYQSRLGNRLFELDLGPIALAFVGASRPEDQRAMDSLVNAGKPKDFAKAWLMAKGMPWAADALDQCPHFPGEAI
jgi:type IV secretion/conjugal transfer VirB4 family ATPase